MSSKALCKEGRKRNKEIIDRDRDRRKKEVIPRFPTKDLSHSREREQEGDSNLAALSAHALCPTCRASIFPSAIIPPAKSHLAKASGWWKLFLLHSALLLECPSPPTSLIARRTPSEEGGNNLIKH
jgi:hypothetical protein